MISGDMPTRDRECGANRFQVLDEVRRGRHVNRVNTGTNSRTGGSSRGDGGMSRYHFANFDISPTEVRKDRGTDSRTRDEYAQHQDDRVRR